MSIWLGIIVAVVYVLMTAIVLALLYAEGERSTQEMDSHGQ